MNQITDQEVCFTALSDFPRPTKMDIVLNLFIVFKFSERKITDPYRCFLRVVYFESSLFQSIEIIPQLKNSNLLYNFH